MDVWYQFIKSFIRLYAAVFIRGIEVEGMENLIPGPKIIAANHAYVSDGYTLPIIVKEKLHFLMQAEAFKYPILGNLLSCADQIPVVRRQGEKALMIAKDRLTQGNSVVIFPEGKLNNGGDFQRSHIGAVQLSILSDVPITPIGFYVFPENTRKFFGRYRKSEVRYQFRGKCFVHIGQQIKYSPNSSSDYQKPSHSHFPIDAEDQMSCATGKRSCSFNRISTRKIHRIKEYYAFLRDNENIVISGRALKRTGQRFNWTPLAFTEETEEYFARVIDETGVPMRAAPQEVVMATVLSLNRKLAF